MARKLRGDNQGFCLYLTTKEFYNQTTEVFWQEAHLSRWACRCQIIAKEPRIVSSARATGKDGLPLGCYLRRPVSFQSAIGAFNFVVLRLGKHLFPKNYETFKYGGRLPVALLGERFSPIVLRSPKLQRPPGRTAFRGTMKP